MSGIVAMDAALWRADLAGRKADDLSALIVSGKVVCNVDADTKLQFRCELLRPEAFRPYVDCLLPELTLTRADGTATTEPVGLYVVVPPPAVHRSRGTTQKPDGRDPSWLLRQATYPTSVRFIAGTNYVTNVEAVIASVSPLLRHAVHPTAQTLPASLSWPPGTAKLKVVNDLLDGIAYYHLHADRRGVLTSRPVVPLDRVEPAAAYASGDGSAIVGDVEDEPDLTRLCNVVTVRRLTPNLPPLYATRRNDTPAGPTSTATLGVELARTVDVPDLADQAAADAQAEAMLAEGASFYRKITLRTVPDPTAGVHDVVTLSVTNPDGEAVAGAWHRLGWELGFRPSDGPMVHKLSRVEVYR